MDDADLVVQPFDEPEGYLVFPLTVGRDTVPMGIDHFGKLLVRLQPLPLELIAPVIEELPGPGFLVIVPKLSKGLLEHVRSVQPLVSGEQDLEILPSATPQVFAVR